MHQNIGGTNDSVPPCPKVGENISPCPPWNSVPAAGSSPTFNRRRSITSFSPSKQMSPQSQGIHGKQQDAKNNDQNVTTDLYKNFLQKQLFFMRAEVAFWLQRWSRFHYIRMSRTWFFRSKFICSACNLTFIVRGQVKEQVKAFDQGGWEVHWSHTVDDILHQPKMHLKAFQAVVTALQN